MRLSYYGQVRARIVVDAIRPVLIHARVRAFQQFPAGLQLFLDCHGWIVQHV
jgi:hypothetical protein